MLMAGIVISSEILVRMIYLVVKICIELYHNLHVAANFLIIHGIIAGTQVS
jgi:hypothetical protein